MLHQHSCRSGRHEISQPSHRRSNGHCAGCARENESKYRRSCRDARRRLAAIEALIA